MEDTGGSYTKGDTRKERGEEVGEGTGGRFWFWERQ